MVVINQNIVDLSQLNLKEMIKKIGEVKTVRVTNIIIENSNKILELQKMLIRLMNEEKEKQENQKRR